VRIDKLLAHAGYGTRKEVRQLIKTGAVTVDEKRVVKNNMHVNPSKEEIVVNGEIVTYEKYVYLMLHKPQGYISATVDDIERTVIDLVPREYDHYPLAPVGRLDKDTEGLLLLTNDGKVNHALTSPKRNVVKTYVAIVDGLVTEEHIAIFASGVILDDGYKTKEATLEIIKSGAQSEVMISITEGKYHQVKRMFKTIGMQVLYLKRIRMGELQLDESLRPGEIRLVTEDEKRYLLSLK